MPYPLLAHQAPVLPLKMWRPALFNGTALVIGSVAPDLQLFWNGGTGAAEFGHSIRGQFTFCLPITLGAVLLIGYLDLGTVIAARVGGLARLAGAALDVTRRGGIVRAVACALCGSFSHVIFDRMTHDMLPAWLPRTVYHLGGEPVTMHSFAQAGVSIVAGMLTVWMVRRIPAAAPPPHRSGALWLAAWAALGAGFGIVRAMPAIRHPDWFFEAGRIYVWGYALFLGAGGGVAGVLLGATALSLRDRRSRARGSAQS